MSSLYTIGKFWKHEETGGICRTLEVINDNKEMVIRKSYANDWTCMADRGALPSQLAHLMAGVNVDALLDRLALRHGMSGDDPRMDAWKESQTRIVKAFGDDPATVKAWSAKQMVFSAEEERALIGQALALEGYGADDEARMQGELDHRLSSLRSMDTQARFDYLIQTAKPHLLEANRLRAEQLSRDVADAIDGFVVMALPRAEPDSAERKAMRSSIVQSIEGLTPTQQTDYLAHRRATLLQQLAVSRESEQESQETALDKNAVIDATKLTRDAYQELLERKLALASTPQERAAMLEIEMEARRLDTKDAEERLAPVSAFYQKVMSGGEVNMTAFLAGRIAGMLSDSVCDSLIPHVKTLFQNLGGVGAWRRKGCEDGLAELQSALAETKATAVYKAFEDDPRVRAACGGRDPGAVLAEHPEMARTEVAMAHVQAQQSAESPRGNVLSPEKGLWAKAVDAAHSLSDRISHLSPEHLVKNGVVDSQWVEKMQKGLGEFAANLKATLMPEKLMEQLQEMLATMLQTIRLMVDMARDMFAGKSATKSADLER